MVSRPFEPLTQARLLSEVDRTKILRNVTPPGGLVRQHIATNGEPDGLSFIASSDLVRIIPVALKLLAESCPLPFTPHVFIFFPHAGIRPHVDGRADVRRCAIIEPLCPTLGYAPTEFWDEGVVTHRLERAGLPALVDLQRVHSVRPTPHIRVNFQLAFAAPYAQVRSLVLAGAFARLRAAVGA